ncbi:MAG TPA: YraN family protein [Myxococcota bacterium]|nr:YraN family protein [Myxococcota bacterium]
MKPRDRRAAGRAGEELAREYLERAGFRIVARNLHLRHAELDLVALDGATLVFVEVRLRRGDRYGSAAESVDARKRRRLTAAASAALARGELPRAARYRFDVIAIDSAHDPPRLTHLRDAFWAQ